MANLSELCSRYQIDLQYDPVTQGVTLKKGSFKARGMLGSNIVVVEGNRVVLSSELRRQRGSVFVPYDFESRVIAVMRDRQATSVKGPWRVAIDAGHGGKDPGAIGRGGIQEKKVVLNIARRVRDRLEAKGLKVIMTRDRDEFVTLERRTEIASRERVDLFVSIHANASPSSGVRGVEIYSLRDLDSKEKREEQRSRNLDLLCRDLSMDHSNSSLRRVIGDMLYDYKREESQKAASALSRGLAQAMDTSSRGTKEAGFFVLRNTLVPAVLVEVGFLSNMREARQLSMSSYQEKIADILADNIVNYLSRWE